MASWSGHTERELRQMSWEISEELVERELARILEPLMTSPAAYRATLANHPADIVGRYEIARPTFSVRADLLEGEAA